MKLTCLGPVQYWFINLQQGIHAQIRKLDAISDYMELLKRNEVIKLNEKTS
jgi:hypothetical protein